MQVWKTAKVIIEGKEAGVKTLFDTGSSFTVMGYKVFRELFGDIPTKPLPRTVEAALANGQKAIIDSFVDSQIVVDDYTIADRIYLSKDIVKKVKMPDLIIGAPTMETWGIELDLKKGDVIIRGGFIL